MSRAASLVFSGLMLISPIVAVAGPAEDANPIVDRWSAAYSGNDPETIAKNYCPDAILLGTVSPVMSEGSQAIITYFVSIRSVPRRVHSRGLWRRGSRSESALWIWTIAVF